MKASLQVPGFGMPSARGPRCGNGDRRPAPWLCTPDHSVGPLLSEYMPTCSTSAFAPHAEHKNAHDVGRRPRSDPVLPSRCCRRAGTVSLSSCSWCHRAARRLPEQLREPREGEIAPVGRGVGDVQSLVVGREGESNCRRVLEEQLVGKDLSRLGRREATDFPAATGEVDEVLHGMQVGHSRRGWTHSGSEPRAGRCRHPIRRRDARYSSTRPAKLATQWGSARASASSLMSFSSATSHH